MLVAAMQTLPLLLLQLQSRALLQSVLCLCLILSSPPSPSNSQQSPSLSARFPALLHSEAILVVEAVFFPCNTINHINPNGGNQTAGCAPILVSSLSFNAPAFPSLPAAARGYNFSAPALFTDVTTCSALRSLPNAARRLVLFNSDEMECSFDEVVRALQSIGSLGGAGSTLAREGAFIGVDHKDLSDVNVPLVSIHRIDAVYSLIALANSNSSYSLMVTLIDNDENLWQQMYHSLEFFLVFRVLLVGWLSGLCLLCCHRIRRWWLVYRSDPALVSNVAVVSLLLELLANVLRVVYLGIDPIFAYHSLSYLTARVLMSISVPFSSATTVLTAFFFVEVTGRDSAMGMRFLNRSKVPYMLVVTALFAADLLTSIISGLYLVTGSFVLLLPSVIDLIVELGFSGLLVVMSIRALRFLISMTSRMDTVSANHFRKRVGKIVSRILFSIFATVLFVLGLALFGAAPQHTEPWGYVWFFAVIVFGASLVSLAHILTFGLPPRLAESQSSDQVKKIHVGDSSGIDTADADASKRLTSPLSANHLDIQTSVNEAGRTRPSRLSFNSKVASAQSNRGSLIEGNANNPHVPLP